MKECDTTSNSPVRPTQDSITGTSQEQKAGPQELKCIDEDKNKTDEQDETE